MSKIIVIKIGTSSVLIGDKLLKRFAREIADLAKSRKVVLVTSGAIGFGMSQCDITQRPNNEGVLQALSCVGQVDLMRMWQQVFNRQRVGQILITRRELDDPIEESRLNSTIRHMWNIGVIPVINENDALSSEEIRIGDNDRLAAYVARHIHADELVILSDVNGVYENFGTKNQMLMKSVYLQDATKMIVSKNSQFGTGGLETKLLAASIAGKGVATYIANARDNMVVSKVLEGKIGTKILLQ